MQRKLRLRKREDFNRVYRQGRSFANMQFVVYWRQRPEIGHFRLGVSASAKLGGAVVRNRLRRQGKEIVRLNADKIRDDLDLILIIRKAAVGMSYKELEKSVLHVLRKAGLLKGTENSAGSGARHGAGGGKRAKPGKEKTRQ